MEILAAVIGLVFPPAAAVYAMYRFAGRKPSRAEAVGAWAMAALMTQPLLTFIFFLLRRAAHAYGGLPALICWGASLLVCTAAAILAGKWMGRRGHALAYREGEEALPDGARSRPARILLSCAKHVWVGFSLLLFIVAFWASRTYANITIDEIIFYASMPLQGTARTFVVDVARDVALPWAVAFCGLEALMHIRSRRAHCLMVEGTRRFWIQALPLRCSPVSFAVLSAALYAWVILCVGVPMGVHTFLLNNLTQSTLIEEEYVDPRSVNIEFPEEKRNLICIFMESAETSSQDGENGGILETNLIPEMTELARENVSFSQSERLEGAAIAPACGWTIAGLVAETGGLPLKLFRYQDADATGDWEKGTDNMASTFAYFLPGATTLGDLLEEQGYRNVFMAGSDFTFGGRRLFFTQHGNYEIWDLLTARELGKIPQDYYVGWGFEDQKLYAFAKEKLLELAEGDEPFNFSMLTVDTHAPGFPCAVCPEGIDDPFARTVACASWQAAEFVAWCQQQDFYENTTIAIMGDHASMIGGFYPDGRDNDYDKHNGSSGNRLVYNAFIHAVAQPVSAKNRRFTTLDFFPTLLASIGARIEGERLALGTNLFSGEPTLSEEYGYEALFGELGRKSNFYNKELLYP